MCDRSSASALMRALVMTSVVLRRVRNCRRIIIIIIKGILAWDAAYPSDVLLF